MLKGYSFSKEKNVFKDYIEAVFKNKVVAVNSTQKSMAKSLLNNLLGRFGIQIHKPITDIVSVKTLDTISTMRKVTAYTQISKDKVLLSYINKLDPSVITSHNLDILKRLNKYKYVESPSFYATYLVISAAVTAYARIYISKLKLNILKQKGKIFYSDTDSIVTNIKLGDDLVSCTELGKLKLEHEIKKGIFISGKTYCFITKKGKYINRAKGIKSNCISYKDYENMLHNVDVTSAVKTQTTRY